jgi:hypothetical protein
MAGIAVLKDELKLHPYDRNSLAAIASFLNQASDPASALSTLNGWLNSSHQVRIFNNC